MNIHNISEAKNHNSVDFTENRDESAPKLSTMLNTGLQDGVDVDVLLSTSTLNQYANMEYNNEFH